MNVTVRQPNKKEKDLMIGFTMPAPLVHIGSLLRCTNANTRRFTHNSVYRVHRTVHNARSGLALPVVRDDNGLEVVCTSLSFSMGHWQKCTVRPVNSDEFVYCNQTRKQVNIICESGW